MSRLVITLFLIFLMFRLTVFIDNSAFNRLFGILAILYLGASLTLRPVRLSVSAWLTLSALLLVIGLGAITIFINDYDPFLFVYDVSRYLTIIALFRIGADSTAHLSPKKIKTAFLGIVVFHLLFAVFEFASGDVVLIGGQLRLGGFFEETAKFGLFFGLVSLILFLLFMHDRNRGLFLTLLLLVLWFLAYNNTMRIIAALLSSFAFYYVVLQRRIGYLILILTTALFLGLLNEEVKERFTSVIQSEILPSKITYGEKLDNSFQWRILQWSMLIEDWYQKHPLTGAGIGQETKLDGIKKPTGEPFISHSDFVKILIETGLIGFGVFIMVISYFYKLNRRILNRHNLRDGLLVFYYFLLCALLGSALHTESFFFYLYVLGYMSTLEPSQKTQEQS